MINTLRVHSCHVSVAEHSDLPPATRKYYKKEKYITKYFRPHTPGKMLTGGGYTSKKQMLGGCLVGHRYMH